jgi:hypothetical protein
MATPTRELIVSRKLARAMPMAKLRAVITVAVCQEAGCTTVTAASTGAGREGSCIPGGACLLFQDRKAPILGLSNDPKTRAMAGWGQSRGRDHL